MKKRYKIIGIISIIFVVTIITLISKEPWFLVLYNLILALFIDEIKRLFYKLPNIHQVRVSYSYIFRIEVSGNYLLVKDEQGRNNYHPVGGVYKYNPEELDIGENFNGEYDGLFNATFDTKDDIRLIIDKKKLDDFNTWFASGKNRENIENLSREFKEELIDRNILSKEAFNTIKYKYIGSHTQKSYNENLHMKQIRHFDVFSIKLTNAQRKDLEQLMSKSSAQYLFATKDIINTGTAHFSGKNYNIAEYSNLILTSSSSDLKKEMVNPQEYTIQINSTQNV